jgi:hypothetical protein
VIIEVEGGEGGGKTLPAYAGRLYEKSDVLNRMKPKPESNRDERTRMRSVSYNEPKCREKPERLRG